MSNCGLILLGILNLNLSSIRISYLGESLFREIDCSRASWWTVIDDFNHNAATLARSWHAPLVCRSKTSDSVPSPTGCPFTPYYITCCSYHDAIVLIAVARRGCESTLIIKFNTHSTVGLPLEHP